MRPVETAQRLALSALMRFPDLLAESDLSTLHFDRPDHQALFNALDGLPAAFRTDQGGAPLAEVARRSDVKTSDLIEISRVQVFNPEQARHYFRELRQLVTLENLNAELDRLASQPPEGEAPAEVALETLQSIQRKYASEIASAETATLDQLMSSFAADRQAEGSGDGPTTVMTGLEAVDVACKGLRPGELTTLFGGGGCGKSALALHIAARLARAGIHTLYFSGEMTGRQLAERLLHAELSSPQSENLGSDDYVANAVSRIRTSGFGQYLHFDTRSRVRPAQMLATCRRLQGQHGVALIVFDHLRHLMVGSSWSEYERLSLAIAEAKSLAKSEAVPFLMLTHTNRLRTGASRPSLEMIRGSGQIEEESDNVLALWRPPESVVSELHVLKARNTGLTIKVDLTFDVRTQKFYEVA